LAAALELRLACDTLRFGTAIFAPPVC